MKIYKKKRFFTASVKGMFFRKNAFVYHNVNLFNFQVLCLLKLNKAYKI